MTQLITILLVSTISFFVLDEFVLTLLRAESNKPFAVDQVSKLSVTKRPLMDTYISSGHEKQGFGSESRIWIGYNQSNGNKIERTLLQFELSEIDVNSRIDSATLSLKLEVITPNDEAMNVRIYRILSNWNNENISWKEFEENHSVMRNISATKVVGTDFIWYHWDIQGLLQAWLDDPGRPPHFSVLIEGNETPGQHERGFWSRNCSTAQCGSDQPILEVNWSLPPTATPTHTLTPTPTPIPVTLGLSQRVLTATPSVDATVPPATAPTRVDVQPSDHIIYTINYNVASAVNNAQLTNQIPANVTPVAENDGGVRNDRTITWNLGNLAKDQNGAVSYEVLYNPSTADLRISTNPTPPIIVVNEKIFISAVTSVAPKRYLWDFGVDKPYESATSIQEHTYTSAGIYDFEVTANYTTCTVTRSTTITVTDNLITHDSLESSIPASVVAEPLMDLPPDQATLVLPPCDAEEPIVNEGATITWQGQQGKVKSNALLLNPVVVLYMPAVSKSP